MTDTDQQEEAVEPRFAVTPADLIETLQERFKVSSVEDLAPHIGQSARQIYRWRNGQEPRFATTIDLLERARLLSWPEEQIGEPDEAVEHLEHLFHEYGEVSWDILGRHVLLEKAVMEWIASRDGAYAEAFAKRLEERFMTRRLEEEEEDWPSFRSLAPRLRALEAKVAELPTADDLLAAVESLREAIHPAASEGTGEAQPESKAESGLMLRSVFIARRSAAATTPDAEPNRVIGRSRQPTRRSTVKLLVTLTIAVIALTAATVATAAPHVSLVKSKSFCGTDAYNAYLYVYVTVENTGGSSGSLKVRPWRRYSDGSVNDSILDTFTVNVNAHKTKKIYGKYSYKATEHELRQCGVYLADSSTVTPLPVIPL